VLDEPTAALDVGHQLDVLELIADLRTERELTVVTTVHDLSVAGQFADRIAVLAGGRLVATGAPPDVLTPEVIAAHWGVDAACEVDDDGAVTVTVRRRRERRDQMTRIER
jgi:iron complex transport system ATP-binding protein